MREILFRAKATNRDPNREYRTDYKNGDWVYGLISRVYDEKFDFPAEMTNTSGISNIEVDPATIGQFTGLTDKNGRKIFEGDIIKGVHVDMLVVEWHNGYFTAEGKRGWLFIFELKAGEVIGNIYDDPELRSENGG